MEDVCTIIASYNDVKGFKPGSHGNGRIVVLKPNRQDFEKKDLENAAFHFRFGTFNIMGRGFDKAYIYIGEISSSNDVRTEMFKAMYATILTLVKDKSKINIVGCSCANSKKQAFAANEGLNFINSECGGKDTLGKIAKDILAGVPKTEEPQANWALQKEYFARNIKEGFLRTTNRFVHFAAIDQVLFAGRSDGQIFMKPKNRWKKTGLKLAQGVNIMKNIDDSLYIGDGTCCSGATWKMDVEGNFEQIFTVEGQSFDHYHKGDICCNVYGFTKFQDKILTGGGGCAGEHIYILNGDGKWEYLKNDPKKYVTAMTTASDGNVYIAMGDQMSNEAIYRYDGKIFQKIGSTDGGVHGIYEFKGQIYAGATNSGHVHPTTYSKGYIYMVERNTLKTVWQGAGGVSRFFVYDECLYAYGTNHADYSTSVLKLGQDGSWQVTAKFPDIYNLFVHNGTLFAGGQKKDGKIKSAAIYRIIT